MSGKKYVPEGVYLVCDKGAKPSELKTLSYTETWLYGEKMTTKVDKVLIVNFEPFGACAAANGSPCTAPVTDWTNVTDKITVGGNELLLENSELPCTLGGNIKIFYSMADAMGALPQKEKSWWEKAKAIGQGYMDFRKGVAKGLWKGLKGTVTGVVDLVVWAGKHTTPYMLLNPQGYAEQIEKDKKTMKALGNLAKKGGTWVYRNSTINMLTDPADYMAAQQENAVMFDKMMDKASNMSAEEWGELTGQIAFEVVLEVATAGGAAALTAVKVADKTIDVARAVDKLEDLSDAARVGDKIVDGSKLPPVPKELGDVVHKIDDVPVKKLDDIPDPPNTFRDKNGKLRNEDGTFAKDPKAKKSSKKPEYNRNMSERRKALLRDAKDPDSGLSDRARKQILESDGKKVPKGHEVSHEKPLYNAKTNEGKKALDVESNMKTQQKQKHRKRHKVCGDQYHEFGPANKPKFYFDDIEF